MVKHGLVWHIRIAAGRWQIGWVESNSRSYPGPPQAQADLFVYTMGCRVTAERSGFRTNGGGVSTERRPRLRAFRLEAETRADS